MSDGDRNHEDTDQGAAREEKKVVETYFIIIFLLYCNYNRCTTLTSPHMPSAPPAFFLLPASAAMESTRRLLLVTATAFISFNVIFWILFDGILASPLWNIPNIFAFQIPVDIAKTKTTTIFGRLVSYKSCPLRSCATLPIGVLSGYATKRQAVRDTWGKNSCVFFIVGKTNGTWPEEEASQHDDLLLLDMEELYYGADSILPYKTALWFRVAHQLFPKAPYILKTDDDSYVKVEGLQAELIQIQPDYWGHVFHGNAPSRDPKHRMYVPSHMWSNEVFPDYCSGAGYVLSREALDCFVSKVGTQTYMAREDVSTGITMQTCGIKSTQTDFVDIFGEYGNTEPWLIKHWVKNFSEVVTTSTLFDMNAWCATHSTLPNGTLCTSMHGELGELSNRSTGPYRVLVTGGAGFIGMHTSLRLQADGHYVVAYDNLNSYYSPALKRARVARLFDQGIIVALSDVCNTTALASVLDEHGIDRVIHLSAQAGVRYSLDHPYEYTRNNIDCFVTLLETLKGRDIRLVYASSSSVYGLNDKVPFAESDPVEQPASLYAATKRMNELVAHVYHNLYGQQSIGLRFFTVYGPWGRPDMAYYSFTGKIIQGETIKMFNHGDLERDFTYIDDVVDGILVSLDLLVSTPQILNLGNNKPVPLKKFIEIIEDSVGKKAIIESVDMQPGDVPRTFAGLTKAHHMLGYEPRTPLEEGIPRFVKWFKEHSLVTSAPFDADVWCSNYGILLNDDLCKNKNIGVDQSLATALLAILNGSVGNFGRGGLHYSTFLKNNAVESTPYDSSPMRVVSVQYADLSAPLNISMPTYDWILCLEAAQHLSEESANTFIDNIAGYANIGMVLAGAGHPHENGLNEHPRDWVIEQLQSRAFTYDKNSSETLRMKANFPSFKNDLMVFRREEVPMSVLDEIFTTDVWSPKWHEEVEAIIPKLPPMRQRHGYVGDFASYMKRRGIESRATLVFLNNNTAWNNMFTRLRDSLVNESNLIGITAKGSSCNHCCELLRGIDEAALPMGSDKYNHMVTEKHCIIAEILPLLEEMVIFDADVACRKSTSVWSLWDRDKIELGSYCNDRLTYNGGMLYIKSSNLTQKHWHDMCRLATWSNPRLRETYLLSGVLGTTMNGSQCSTKIGSKFVISAEKATCIHASGFLDVSEKGAFLRDFVDLHGY